VLTTPVPVEDVCEDAITLRQSGGTSTIDGGGAKNADDKIVQHNGAGTVVIKNFCAQNFGKVLFFFWSILPLP
jgi:pectate lyase